MTVILVNNVRENGSKCTCPRTVLYSGAIEPWQARDIEILAAQLGCTEDAIIRAGITIMIGLMNNVHQVPDLHTFPTVTLDLPVLDRQLIITKEEIKRIKK